MRDVLPSICLENCNGEIVEIEPDAVYPLIKGSRFKQPLIHDFDKYVLVTQKNLREPTAHLSTQLPRTWAYLQDHQEEFIRKNSSIYQNALQWRIHYRRILLLNNSVDGVVNYEF